MSSRLNFSKTLDFVGDVAANGNPRVHIDGGVTIEEMTLSTNLAPSEFTFIVEVDGDLRIKMTGQELIDREDYPGRTATAGQYVLSFADPMAKSLIGEAATSLTTQVNQRVMVSLEIGESVAAGSPSANLYLETTENRPEEFRLYIVPEVMKVTQVGENDYDGFRKAKRIDQLKMRRAFLYGAVSKLRIEQDDRAVFGKRNLEKNINDARLKRNGLTPPANCYVFDPLVKGNAVADLFDMWVNEVPTRATLTTTNTTDVKALVEYFDDVRVINAG
jgi:hypothetical protein